MYQIASLVLLLLAAATRPHRAQCPPGRDLRMGVRRDGRFACWSTPVGDPDYDGTFGRPDRSVQRDDALEGRVYCARGEVPIVEPDGRSVTCRDARGS